MAQRLWLLAVGLWAATTAAGDILEHSRITELFEPVQSRWVPLHRLQATELKHKTTGAQVLLLVPQDETIEKAFAASFRTPAQDDTGVTHIIEHAVLSGSQKYPVRFPLHHFRKSSMATFVNAMTYPDRTTYPVATVNSQDLLNLASVYMDAVFFPLALESETAFEREGWHLQFDQSTNEPSFSGVVYNEMKGVFSDPRSIGFKSSMRSLLRNCTYQYTSGGFPPAIPTLTYDSFRAYYMKHYHPINSYFYYFGSLDRVDELLEMIDTYVEKAAARNEQEIGSPHLIPQMTAVTPPAAMEAPLFAVQRVPTSETDPRDTLFISSLIGDTAEGICERLTLDLVSHLVVDKRETPLYHRLVASGLGSSVIPYGIFDYGAPLLFGVGVQGVPKNWTCSDPECEPFQGNVSAYFHWIVYDELEKIATSGFDSAEVKAALNTFEFRIRESAASQANRGMAFLDTVFDEWNHDRDPTRGLDLDTALTCVRETVLGDPNHMSDLIRNRLINNQHRVIMTMEADPTYDEKREARERIDVEEKVASMTASDLELAAQRAHALEESQEAPDSPEALATLPKLPLSVVDAETKYPPRKVILSAGVPTVMMDLPTSNIAYIALYLDMLDLKADELMLHSLMQHLILHGDTMKETSKSLSRLLESTTGGLRASVSLNNNHPPGYVAPRDEASAWLEISFKCLDTALTDCVNLVVDILETQDFEKNGDRARRWLRERVEKKEAQVLSSPSSFAQKTYEGLLTLTGRVVELSEGVQSIANGRACLAEAESNWNNVAQKLQNAWEKILVRNRMAMRIAADGPTLRNAIQAMDNALGRLPFASGYSRLPRSFTETEGFRYQTPRWAAALQPPTLTESTAMLIDIPSMVSYNYLGGFIYPPGSHIPYRHVVPAKALSLDYIFARIRFMGGAYGAGVSLKLSDGRFTFNSYRDPHVTETFETMLRSPDAMSDLAASVSEAEIEQYIIRAISQMDAPESNSAKSSTAFNEWALGETKAHKQRIRDELFSVSREDFVEFAESLKEAIRSHTLVAVSFGPSAPLEEREVQGLPPFIIRTVNNE